MTKVPNYPHAWWYDRDTLGRIMPPWQAIASNPHTEFHGVGIMLAHVGSGRVTRSNEKILVAPAKMPALKARPQRSCYLQSGLCRILGFTGSHVGRQHR